VFSTRLLFSACPLPPTRPVRRQLIRILWLLTVYVCWHLEPRRLSEGPPGGFAHTGRWWSARWPAPYDAPVVYNSSQLAANHIDRPGFRKRQTSALRHITSDNGITTRLIARMVPFRQSRLSRSKGETKQFGPWTFINCTRSSIQTGTGEGPRLCTRASRIPQNRPDREVSDTSQPGTERGGLLMGDRA
jgi:hypothetical protein